jgi:hypothetical protein
VEAREGDEEEERARRRAEEREGEVGLDEAGA